MMQETNTKITVAVVNLPVQRIIIYNDKWIIASFTGREFNKQFGGHMLNRSADKRGWRRYAALSFTDGMQPQPLTPDPDTDTLRMSGPALWSWLLSLARARPADADGWNEIDPRDLAVLFEGYSNSRNRAEAWLDECLPFLLAQTPVDDLPDGAERLVTVMQERAMRGHLWAGRRLQ